MTFSIVARCEETGMFGVAVTSSSPAVAARCAYAQAGVGAVSSQNITDPRLGRRSLDLLALDAGANDVIRILQNGSPDIEYRQLLAVDKNGRAAVHSGKHTLGIWAEAHADNVACAGNLLANDSIPLAMLDDFRSSRGHLGDRLISALRAGRNAGGEMGPVKSAGMKLVGEVEWPVADLRCDWSDDCPIENMATLWELYRPQMDAYVTRALHPNEAPSYGVPGDE